MSAKLLNARQIAAELGVSEWWIASLKRAAKTAGDSPFRGMKSTAEWVLGWIENHPEFVAGHQWRKP